MSDLALTIRAFSKVGDAMGELQAALEKERARAEAAEARCARLEKALRACLGALVPPFGNSLPAIEKARAALSDTAPIDAARESTDG